MRCVLAVLLAAFLLSALAPAAPVPTHLVPKSSPFEHPTAIGTKWVYDDLNEEVTHVITAVKEEKRGAKVITVSSLNTNGTMAFAYKLRISERGWHEVAWANVSKRAPIPKIKFPIDCEHEWEYRGPHYQWASTQIPKTGIVKVPAGTFKAVKVVDTEDTPNGFKVHEERWYASGVGLVQIGGNWPSRTLKSFTPGDGKKP